MSSSEAWRDWWRGRADERARRDQRRRPVPTLGEGGRHVHREGRRLVSFAGSDYLGLSRHPEVRAAVSEAVATEGLGERSASLITGHHPDHEALAAELAALTGAETGMVFASGWAANVGLLDALAGSDLAIFSDALNHASLIDGCRLARSRGAEVTVFPHRDHEALEVALAACTRSRRLVVSDTVFSMESEPADVDALLAVCARHDALLHLDEAHGTLVLGPGGGGVAEGRTAPRIIRTVTLGKALGSQGALVLGSEEIVSDLRQTVRSYVFSTALARPLVVAARTALAVYRRRPELRARLDAHRARLGKAFGVAVPTPIVPLVLGEEARALALSQRLAEAGYHVPAIRPPTVPKGTSRLRFVLSASLEEADLDGVVEVLHEAGALQD